ncbi:hypothetical protein GCM10011419_30070 [Vogesella fluminis]|uniref:Uncharacterized protein n=1 Tax=Vogesella fluminis TaxID=1069161 RepID=A0ABQ3HF82_9NEIS|nr:hypothetical protein GCM10011419_30070 [Vogesella fluminis]
MGRWAGRTLTLKLKEIGLFKDQVLNEIAQVKAQVLLDHAKAKRALTPPQEDHDNAS